MILFVDNLYMRIIEEVDLIDFFQPLVFVFIFSSQFFEFYLD